MPWAAGSYTKGNSGTGGWVGDASLGIGIEAGRHDTQDNDFATGINQCLNKDGSNAATGNLNLGGFKYTNSAAATLRTDLPQVAQVQDGDFIWLGTTSGTATAQTASASPAITAYKAGQKFRMKIGSGLGSTGSSATAHTLNVNSLGAKNLKNNEDGTDPTVGTWVAGAIMEVVYDGTNFIITNNPGGWLTYTPTITPASGTASGATIAGAYLKIGKQVSIVIRGFWTQNTSNTLYVTLNAPILAATLEQFFVAGVTPTGGATVCGACFNSSTSDIRVYVYDGTTNITTGSNRFVYIQGVYRSV